MMYSPLIGHFAQRDPLGYAAGDENLYRYVGDRPTDGTDPSGLASITDMGPVKPWGTSQNGGPVEPPVWIRSEYKETAGDMTVQLYNKSKETEVEELNAEYDSRSDQNLWRTRDNTFAGTSPAIVKISYKHAAEGDNRIEIIQIVRTTLPSGSVLDYQNFPHDGPHKEYLLRQWLTESDTTQKTEFGWHLDSFPTEDFNNLGRSPFNGESAVLGTDTAETSIWDSPEAWSMSRDLTGTKFEFEDYAVCVSTEGGRHAGVILMGMKWGFVQKSVKIQFAGLWSLSVDSRPVFTMLPAKSLGKTQTPEFKAALAKYSAYWGQKTVTYADGHL